jgi:hypothetical protein
VWLRGGKGQALDTFEILDCGGASEVEEVLANAYVASAMALASRDMCESVFDGGSLAECGAPGGRLLELSVLTLAGFVGGDGDAAAVARGGLGALCA